MQLFCMHIKRYRGKDENYICFFLAYCLIFALCLAALSVLLYLFAFLPFCVFATSWHLPFCHLSPCFQHTLRRKNLNFLLPPCHLHLKVMILTCYCILLNIWYSCLLYTTANIAIWHKL